MTLSTKLLIAEADRLLTRAEKRARLLRRRPAHGEFARQAELEVKRLQLYRAVLAASNSAQALMPEYVFARGLLPAEEIAATAKTSRRERA
jgi:hypothetical protein